MLHRLTHDDRMRLLRATLPEISSQAEEFSPADPPVQLTRTMVNRASVVLPSQLARLRQARGGTRGLLRLGRELRAK